jgi:RNA polymerase sigma factor (sigma-70 family)
MDGESDLASGRCCPENESHLRRRRTSITEFHRLLQELDPRFRVIANSLMCRSHPVHLDADDLMQEARLGAYGVWQRRPEDGDHLIALMYVRGKGSMLDHLRTHRWTPRGCKEPIKSFVSYDQGFINVESSLVERVTPDHVLYAKQKLAALVERAAVANSKGARQSHIEVLQLIADGKSYAEAGKELGVSHFFIWTAMKRLWEYAEKV